jgi:hypothetical protein
MKELLVSFTFFTALTLTGYAELNQSKTITAVESYQIQTAAGKLSAMSMDDQGKIKGLTPRVVRKAKKQAKQALEDDCWDIYNGTIQEGSINYSYIDYQGGSNSILISASATCQY